MHQASVGFQCPECSKTGAQKVYQGTSAFAPSRPVVTMALIGVNVAVFVLAVAISGGAALRGAADTLQLKGGLIAELFERGDQYFRVPVPGSTAGGVAHGEWYRIFTSGFLHYGMLHIALNMWALYIFGRILEVAGGRWRFGAVYAVSLVAGALGAMILSPDSLTAGASGAIYGLLGALIVLHRARGIPLRDTGLITILVLNMVLSFGISGISIGGHLGGLVGGGIAGYVLYDLGARRDLPKALPWVLSAVLFVGCFVGTILVADSAAHF